MLINSRRHIALSTYQAGLLQSKAYRALTTFMTEALAKHSLSLPQWAALGLLHDEKECRPSSIAEALGVKPPVATRLLNELEDKGLVVRIPHPNDNRGATVCITEQTSELVTEVERQLRTDMRRFFSDVKVTELFVYLKVLSKLAAKL